MVAKIEITKEEISALDLIVQNLDALHMCPNNYYYREKAREIADKVVRSLKEKIANAQEGK